MKTEHLTPKEYAQMRGISVSKVYKLCNTGQLPAPHIARKSASGNWRIEEYRTEPQPQDLEEQEILETVEALSAETLDLQKIIWSLREELHEARQDSGLARSRLCDLVTGRVESDRYLEAVKKIKAIEEDRDAIARRWHETNQELNMVSAQMGQERKENQKTPKDTPGIFGRLFRRKNENNGRLPKTVIQSALRHTPQIRDNNGGEKHIRQLR